ncbi:MAG: histidine triad nucleotide-binding protein [Ignavibacteriaceae bacterium]|nr:histidine triad nucleotide-binding protein [Ignavibacteriaceae bacterium]
MADSIFIKIIKREIPAKIVYEDDSVIAIDDINPKAPVHVLIIPKIEFSNIYNINGSANSPLLGKLFDAVNKVADLKGCTDTGFRIVINNGRSAGQEVDHLHLHLLGGRTMNWPPG